jgi:hypothetical protein
LTTADRQKRQENRPPDITPDIKTRGLCQENRPRDTDTNRGVKI